MGQVLHRGATTTEGIRRAARLGILAGRGLVTCVPHGRIGWDKSFGNRMLHLVSDTRPG